MLTGLNWNLRNLCKRAQAAIIQANENDLTDDTSSPREPFVPLTIADPV